MRAIIAAMNGMLQVPTATSFDAVASLVSLVVYVGAALLAVARRPRDPSTRVFLVVALTSAAPYVLAILQWWKGSGVYVPATIALTAAAFCLGSAALFHFTQVFPWRRPWILAHGRWLIAAYVVPVIPVALTAWTIGRLLMSAPAPDPTFSGVSDTTLQPGLTDALMLLASLPFILIIGVVLPLAGVTSIVKSWREAKASSNEPARVTTFWMLMSQMGGGVLAILVLPLLHVIGVGAAWVTLFGALAYLFAIIMPIAYLLTGVLGSDAPGSTSTAQLPTPHSP
jgi:hypothetical protein